MAIEIVGFELVSPAGAVEPDWDDQECRCCCCTGECRQQDDIDDLYAVAIGYRAALFAGFAEGDYAE